MGTHPIFESDFDCLTVVKQWFSGSPTVVRFRTIHLPTEEKLSRPLAADLSINTLVNWQKPPNVVILACAFAVLKLAAPANWPRTQNDRRRLPVLTVVHSVAPPSALESFAPSSSGAENRRQSAQG